MPNDGLIHYNRIVEGSLTDGPGIRTVLFMQGCTIHCPGCQNQHLWEQDGALVEAPFQVAEKLLATGQAITLTGGEPTDQPLALYTLIITLKRHQPAPHIIVYTGRTLDDVAGDKSEAGRQALAALISTDVVVDGPFIAAQDDDMLQWKGSGNQRPIDMQATLWAMFQAEDNRLDQIAHYIVPAECWDTMTLIITPRGVVGPAGLIEKIAQEGDCVVDHRPCGSTRT
jgi:anaerobic ribonucleoside-triphosphate reductase activating protein